jgi:DnaJ-class molecular chaperone
MKNHQQNLYEVLNLSPSASEGQIKSSYRRLAKRYHPDLNPHDPKATDKFRELQNAYDVLADPTKREAYDATLPAHQNHRKRSYSRPNFTYRPKPRYQRPLVAPDKPRAAYLEYILELTWEELAKGSKQFITVGQLFTCPTCLGKMRILINEKYQKCPRCAGWGFLVNYQKVEVIVPPGILPDMTMRVPVGAHTAAETKALVELPLNNHITIHVKVRENPTFSHRDQHLFTTITVPQSLLEKGGEYNLKGPEGNLILVNIPAHTSSGTTLTVRKQGLRSGSSLKRGNLYCTVLAE